MSLQCQECLTEVNEGEAVNGYCPKCLEQFQKMEEASERAERERETPLGEWIEEQGELAD